MNRMQMSLTIRSPWLATAFRRWLGASLLVGLSLLALAPPGVVGQQTPPGGSQTFGLDPNDTTPTVERTPFDRVTLKESGNGAILYCQPLGLLGPVDPSSQSGDLKFELLDRPDQTFTVRWSDVARVELFAEIVIAETRAAFESGDFNLAFRNLLYLHDTRGASDPIVEQLLEPFWFADAKALFDAGNQELALTGFEELYQRNPNFAVPGEQYRPADYIAAAYQRSLQGLADQGNFEGLVAKLADIRSKYSRPPVQLSNLLRQWDGVLEQKRQAQLDAWAAQAADDNLIVAHQAVRAWRRAATTDSRAAQAMRDLFAKQPAIVVGTLQPEAAPGSSRLDNWAARRLGSLLSRNLVDLVGLGDDGGIYEYNEGLIVAVDEFGRAYRFEIDPSKQHFQDKTTALDLVQRLSQLVDEKSPEFYFPLAKIVQSLEIIDDRRVQVQLTRPCARFESLFRVPLHSAAPRCQGWYERDPTLDGSPYQAQVFRPSAAAEWEIPLAALPRIIERRFTTGSEATRALLHGEIDVLERVPPADLEKLRADPEIAVREYLIPSVHMLIPNQRNAFMRDATFRRGLLYAVDRPTIVRQLLCGGRDIIGMQTISGPFPMGSEENDLIGYAYDFRVSPTDYDSRMALIAPSVVLNQMRKTSKERLQQERSAELRDLNEDELYKKLEEWVNQDPALAIPTLILVHPDTDSARNVCQAMQRMWQSVGIPVELKALPPGASRPADDQYDLWYVELTLEEPLADTRQILGDLGIVREISPSIEQLLGELDVAKNWVEARNILRQIHELCQSEMLILPLWQTANFYAYRRNLTGIDSGLVHLYERVNRWRIDVPAEAATAPAGAERTESSVTTPAN